MICRVVAVICFALFRPNSGGLRTRFFFLWKPVMQRYMMVGIIIYLANARLVAWLTELQICGLVVHETTGMPLHALLKYCNTYTPQNEVIMIGAKRRKFDVLVANLFRGLFFHKIIMLLAHAVMMELNQSSAPVL